MKIVNDGYYPERGDEWYSKSRKHWVRVVYVREVDESVSVSWSVGRGGGASMPMRIFLDNYTPYPLKPERPSQQAYFFQMALSASERSTCPRLKVGCVAVREGVVFGQGYNGKARGESHCVHDNNSPCEDSVHAEANLIASAARLGNRLSEASLYVTHAPCLSCARLIINAGFESVSYWYSYRDTAGIDLLQERGMIV